MKVDLNTHRGIEDMYVSITIAGVIHVPLPSEYLSWGITDMVWYVTLRSEFRVVMSVTISA